MKKQRERIKDDDVYFTTGKPPVNAPEWTCKESSNIYETEYETDLTQYDDTEEYRERDNDIEEYIQYGNVQGYKTELVQDFVRDSAESALDLFAYRCAAAFALMWSTTQPVACAGLRKHRLAAGCTIPAIILSAIAAALPVGIITCAGTSKKTTSSLHCCSSCCYVW